MLIPQVLIPEAKVARTNIRKCEVAFSGNHSNGLKTGRAENCKSLSLISRGENVDFAQFISRVTLFITKAGKHAHCCVSMKVADTEVQNAYLQISVRMVSPSGGGGHYPSHGSPYSGSSWHVTPTLTKECKDVLTQAFFSRVIRSVLVTASTCFHITRRFNLFSLLLSFTIYLFIIFIFINSSLYFFTPREAAVARCKDGDEKNNNCHFFLDARVVLA